MRKTFIIAIALAIALSGCELLGGAKAKELTLEEAKAKAVDFINKNLVQPGSEVSVKEASEENGLYKLTVNMSNGQEIVSYLTKDGKKFFPQVLDIAEYEAQNADKQANEEAAQAQAAANVPKAEKAVAEAFVMSHCPYGTQIEKGLLPVMKALGDKADIKIKFVDYAMHGEKEVYEQLNQYCIDKEQTAKFIPYLECFLEAGDGEGCLKTAGVDARKLKACADKADKEFKITELFKDQSSWSGGRFPQFNVHKAENDQYGVSGSPTLVVNGQTVNSGRDAASLLKNICAGFENPPAECDTELSSTAPGPGFGLATTGSNSAASCE